ncbi:hypothetical protein M2428_001948 [Arthrobacter sp. ES3-54]|nr:hypothetical protein [Arthrobacter sp. ES3-54]
MRRPIFPRLVLIATIVGLSLVPLPAKAAGGVATDKVVSAHQASLSRTVTSPAFTTSQTKELLVAFVTSDGRAETGAQQFTSVTGGGLTWRLRKRTNVQFGTAEIWQAVSSGILTNARVTATHNGSYRGSITVATFTGADTATDGAVGGASGPTGAPTASLSTTRTGSWVWGVGNDWSASTARTVGSGQTKVDEYLAGSGGTFWTQRQTVPGTVTAPSTVRINDTAPTTDRWNMSLIEVRPAPAAPVFTASSPPATATVGTAYTYTFAATGSPAPTFRVASGALPAGLGLNSTSGVLSGTPTTAGPATFTVAAANGVSPDAVTPSRTITVNPAPAPDGTQAAVVFGWGPVVTGDEFSYTGAPNPLKWGVYNSPGHAGNGIRSPNAWSVNGSVVTVSGDSAGTTGGMSAKFAQQQYGRWEVRMKTSARDPKYHPVLILWPNNNTSPNCAEIDYAEGTSDTSRIKFFLHYACSGSNFQTQTAQPIDTTQWHNYAVQWTPSGITGYIDGVQWFTDTDPAHQPTVGMHQTIQLDWFPDGTATLPSQMQVDWIRVYG